MAIALEHDQRLRGNQKSPISIRNKPVKPIENRKSLRNSKEIARELELIRRENEMMQEHVKIAEKNALRRELEIATQKENAKQERKMVEY